MKKKRVILGLFLFVIAALAVGYKYDVSTFEANLNTGFSELKDKKEIKSYSIQSKGGFLEKRYDVEVDHTNDRKGKYPKKIEIYYNPFALKKNELAFALNN
ncbi:hypothetical protein D929_00029 [Enterococcus faecalis 02-MB-P-10]|uniref:hypothetical protein n=1 Tax=Enterococcus faecalis TaxID=1351 RepID=UPI0003538AC5|nr:hypothetical protein [Enterococcus faecalis]EPH77772.1 hypothetical protein D929_00029 [Enterococcus faecalis 02-MB-P-10]